MAKTTADSSQLDLFADGHGTLLRNNVVNAILRCNFTAARAAIKDLSAAMPSEPLSGRAEILLQVEGFPGKVDDHGHLARLMDQCDDGIVPSAVSALGQAAGKEWLGSQVWSRLASAAAELPFNPDYPEACSAALWLRAQEWRRAGDDIDRIASWRRIPYPLQWRIRSTVALDDGLDAVWPMIFELAWMAPAMMPRLVDDLDDQVLRNLVKEFGRTVDEDAAGGTAAWFPAFALVVCPSLARHAPSAHPAKESDATRAFACASTLLALERQGSHHEVAQERKRLRGLHEGLFQRYMATR